MSQSTTVNEKNSALQLKGGLYTLTAIQLLSNDIKLIASELEAKINQAPKFFYNAPLVIDLQKLDPKLTIDFKDLKKLLLQKQLIPVGIKGGEFSAHNAAIEAGFAILSEGKEKEQKSKVDQQKLEQISIHSDNDSTDIEENSVNNENKKEFSGSNTKIILEPVRSGQQIYARLGDLIILSSVSHGSEILADGHIHVYGPLRGRALAGVTGDLNARIFCQSLEAELISIAGQYKISEDIEKSLWRSAVEVYLEEGRLHIRPL